MATIQQSIDVHAPIHTVFDRLAHFEDYPRFMDEVQDVRAPGGIVSGPGKGDAKA